MGSAMKKKPSSAAQNLAAAYKNEQQVAQGVNPFRAGEEVSAERQQQAQAFCERYGPSIEQALEKVSSLSEARSGLNELRKDAKEALPTDAEAALMIFGGTAMGGISTLVAAVNEHPFVLAIHGEAISPEIATVNESMETVKTAREAPTELIRTYESFERSMIKLDGALKRFENSVIASSRAINSGNPEKINAAMAKMEKNAKAVARAGESAQSGLETFSGHAANFHLATGVVTDFKDNAQSAIVSTIAMSVGIGALGLALRGAKGLAQASSYGRTQVALAESGALLRTVNLTGQTVNLTLKGGKALSALGRGGKLITQNAPAMRVLAKQAAKQAGKQTIKRTVDALGAEQSIEDAVHDTEEYTEQVESQSRPKPPETRKEEPKTEPRPTAGTREPEIWEEHDYSKGQTRME